MIISWAAAVDFLEDLAVVLGLLRRLPDEVGRRLGEALLRGLVAFAFGTCGNFGSRTTPDA